MVFLLSRNFKVKSFFGTEKEPVLSDTLRLSLNDISTYELEVPFNAKVAQVAELGDYIRVPFDGFELEFRIYRIEDELYIGKTRRFICISSATELSKRFVRPVTYSAQSAESIISSLLQNSPFEPGEIHWLGTRTISFEDYPSTLKALRTVASEFGGDLEFVIKDGDRVVNLKDRDKRKDTGVVLYYKRGVEGIKRTFSFEDAVTALIGLGAQDENGNRLTFSDVTWSTASGDPVDKPSGQDWVGHPDALQWWGLTRKTADGKIALEHLYGIYEDPDEKDASSLLQKTWNALLDRIEEAVTYEIDISYFPQLQDLWVGDIIHVRDEDLNPPVTFSLPIIELEKSIFEKKGNSYAFKLMVYNGTAGTMTVEATDTSFTRLEGIFIPI